MSFPVMTLTNATATGDVIIGPGCPTVLVKGLPVACIGDMVAGAVCVTGAVTVPTAPNKVLKGRPTAAMSSVVAGVSAIGMPVSTVCAVTPNVNSIF